MENKWKNEIDNLISEKTTLKNVANSLSYLKEHNISQSDVINYLNQIRESYIAKNDDKDDWILEILDIATGYCKKEYRVW